MDGNISYSSIPAAERPSWSDDDLSGAIWDEAIDRAGGYEFTPADVAGLPFGFRAVLAEGSVRAHTEGDGLACSIWNDDGIELFEVARDCHAQLGNDVMARELAEVVASVRDWQTATGKTPRDLEYKDFLASDLGRALDDRSNQFCDLANEAFPPMMRHLRAHPELFE